MAQFVILHSYGSGDKVLVNIDQIVTFKSFHHRKLEQWNFSVVFTVNQEIQVQETMEEFRKIITRPH